MIGRRKACVVQDFVSTKVRLLIKNCPQILKQKPKENWGKMKVVFDLNQYDSKRKKKTFEQYAHAQKLRN